MSGKINVSHFDIFCASRYLAILHSFSDGKESAEGTNKIAKKNNWKTNKKKINASRKKGKNKIK